MHCLGTGEAQAANQIEKRKLHVETPLHVCNGGVAANAEQPSPTLVMHSAANAQQFLRRSEANRRLHAASLGALPQELEAFRALVVWYAYDLRLTQVLHNLRRACRRARATCATAKLLQIAAGLVKPLLYPHNDAHLHRQKSLRGVIAGRTSVWHSRPIYRQCADGSVVSTSCMQGQPSVAE